MKYKGTILGKGSAALELFESKDLKKLDEHMKELDRQAKERGDVVPEHLRDYKIGEHPEDWV